MSHTNTSTAKALELFTLKFEHRLSHRKIAKKLNMSAATVSDMLWRFHHAQLVYPLPCLTDHELFTLLYPAQASNVKTKPDFDTLHQQLKIQGMTKKALWQKYCNEHPKHFYGFTQFCMRYQSWLQKQKRSVRQLYTAGEQLFVNYVSPAIHIVNPDTGEMRDVILFVATLGASNYTYVEAIEHDDIESALIANVNALSYFGGSTKKITTYQEANFGTNTAYFKENCRCLAKHYNIKYKIIKLAVNQRKRKPEHNLHVITRWLLMMIHSTNFYTLTSLQSTLTSLSAKLNQKPIKPLNESRSTRFKLLDTPSLNHLPHTHYEFVDHRTVKPHLNHHVLYKGHYYSVHVRYTGCDLTIRASASSVKIYNDDGFCIAQHTRAHKEHGYTTVAEHMPTEKGSYKWSPQSFLRWAKNIGSATTSVINSKLHSKPHPEHSYRICWRILSLSKQYNKGLLETACINTRNLEQVNVDVIEQAMKAELQRNYSLGG